MTLAVEQRDRHDDEAPPDAEPAVERPPPRRTRRLPLRREVPASLHHWSGFAVIAAAHGAERRYARALDPLGMTSKDFLVLAIVGQKPGITATAIGEQLGMSRSRVSGLVTEIEANGWLDRAHKVRDQRRKGIWLSREGSEIFERARERIAAADDDWQQGLQDGERRAMRAALLRLAPNYSATSVWGHRLF